MARHSTVTTKSSAMKASRKPGPTGAAALHFSGGAAAAARGFAVPVDPTVLKILSARPSTVKSLVEQFGHLVTKTKASGKARGFTVMIDAKGNAKFGPLPQRDAPISTAIEDERLEAALAAARERGRLRSAEILDQDDMLTAEQFAERLGVSRMTVNARRQKHELLGLDGAKRGFRFPAWQVDDDGKAFDALPQLFDLLGENAWTVYRFLTQRHAALEGIPAKDALRQGKTPQVLQAAESLAQGDFA
jgi:DNA-binding transcriptional ArsR family regulator